MSTVPSSITVNLEVLSGTPCFEGTRVPVQTLIDYLKAGDRIDDFLTDFPSVRPEQVSTVLDEVGEAVKR